MTIKRILYGLTLTYCFIIGCTGMGDTSEVAFYLEQRSFFYVPEVILLIITLMRCKKLNSDFDYDYFNKTEKIFDAAECCFVMIVIVIAFSVAEIISIFVFLPKKVYNFGAANGFFALLLITVFVFLFYAFTAGKFRMAKKHKEEIRHPLGEKTEDFYAFIHQLDEKQEETELEELPDEDMPDASSLLDTMVPSKEEFDRHLKQISAANPLPEPKQLWECPCCGSLNPTDSKKCEFCGTEREQ